MYPPPRTLDLHHHNQALAAEFPTAAGVRPVFTNLANVYELLRSKSSEGEGQAADQGDGAAAKGISESERAMLPFEGRLLMFRRGNGVEETTGRLLLRKLDYLQVRFMGDTFVFCFPRVAVSWMSSLLLYCCFSHEVVENKNPGTQSAWSVHQVRYTPITSTSNYSSDIKKSCKILRP